MLTSSHGAGTGAVTTDTETLRLQDLTWPEIRAFIDAGFKSIVIPSGAIEQHGPHLALGTDTYHAIILADNVAKLLGETLVAPPVNVGCSDHHLEFAGLEMHGFETVLLLSGHGGNYPALIDLLPRLQAEFPKLQILAFTDLKAFIDIWAAVAQEHIEAGDRVGGHADVAESSVMLAIRPDLVRLDAVEEGPTTVLDAEMMKRIWDHGIKAVSPNGVLGNPVGLSVPIGIQCVDEVAELMADYFRTALVHDDAKGTEGKA
ncbi:MAG: creatininase family protein [Actinobacteria bacterium]|nr:creatininase family protein [Actinomycetota bacterium]